MLGESGREALGSGHSCLWAGRGGDGSQGWLSPFPVILDAAAAGIGRKLELKPPKVCVLQAKGDQRSLDLPIPSLKWRSGGGRAAGEGPGCSRAL